MIKDISIDAEKLAGKNKQLQQTIEQLRKENEELHRVAEATKLMHQQQ